MKSISIDKSHVSLSELFPHLKKIQNLEIARSAVNNISLPMAKVIGDVKIENNTGLSYIRFPRLETVKYLQVWNNTADKMDLRSLKVANFISVSREVKSINIPTSVKIKSHSSVTSIGLCLKKRKGSRFDPNLEVEGCADECFTNDYLNSTGIQITLVSQYFHCRILESLVLDGSNQIFDYWNSNLKHIIGNLVLKSFAGKINCPELDTVNGMLEIKDTSLFSNTSLANIQVGSLKVDATTRIPSLYSTTLAIENNVIIRNTNMKTLYLSSPTTLNRIVLFNNMDLSDVVFSNLTSLRYLSIKNNPKLSLENIFPKMKKEDLEKAKQAYKST